MSTSILLATGSVAFEHHVRRVCQDMPERSIGRWQSEMLQLDTLQAAKELASEEPSVIAIGPNVATDTALDLAEILGTEHPEISVLLVVEPTPDIWERALRAGVRDVLAPDADEGQTRRVLERLLEAAVRQRLNLGADATTAGDGARVITVMGPKGGVGKTFVTSNLAVGLAAGGAGRVALVDLDLQFGDVAATLDLHPEHSIGDLSSSAGATSLTTLKVYLTPRGENLYVLTAPGSPAEGELVTVATVERALRHLTADFDYVVVDTSAGLSEATLAAVEMSTDLVFMCDMSVSALRSLRKVIDAVDALGFVSPTRHLVLNRADVVAGIETEEAAALAGLPIAVEIPTGRSVALAMNQGSPIIESEPRSRVGRSLSAVTELFHQPEDTRSGIFRRKQ